MTNTKNIRVHSRSFAVLFLLFGGASAEEKFPAIGTYNQGVAHYRTNNFQASEKLFAEAAAQTSDEELKQKALYNRGTALLAGAAGGQITNRLESVAEAINLLEQSLELKPEDIDAKQNIERALNWMVTDRIKQATRLIHEADQMLTENQAKTAKENYEAAQETLAPVQENFAPNHAKAEQLKTRADQQLQRLERAVALTREEMEHAKQALDLYEYQTAATLMVADKPERHWAFDLDEELAEEFQQLIQNNQNVIKIIYPSNPLNP